MRIQVCAGAIATAVAIGTLAACSNLSTVPFAPEKQKSGTNLAGVPFTLNRMSFKVVRTPNADGKSETYTATPTYVPDNRRRYQVQIDPALFASVDWTLTYDDMGILVSTNAKMTDQSVPVLKSVATLVGT